MVYLQFESFPQLITERLLLRQLQLTDAPAIMQLRSDEQVNTFLGRKGTISMEEATAFIHKIETTINNKDGLYWAITLKHHPALIGTICYWNIVREKNMAEMGYELFPAFQGKGLMQEAISTLINFGFEQMNLEIITALPEAGNIKSIRVLEKNKFIPDEHHQFVSKEEADGLLVYYLTKKKQPGY